MNYDLAKELQEAGFPLIAANVSASPERIESGVVMSSFRVGDLWYSFPTLSELIAACGDPFLILKHNLSDQHNPDWEAGSYWHQNTHQVYGNSPEEAVARLWLAINKK